MKKEEMIQTMNEGLSNMTEEGVKAFFDVFASFGNKERWNIHTTPERIAELDAMNKQKKLEEEKAEEEECKKKRLLRIQTYSDHADLFKLINEVEIPENYEISMGEIMAIDLVHGQISKCFPEYTFEVSNDYFRYGFAKGLQYAKEETDKNKKKKATNCN